MPGMAANTNYFWQHKLPTETLKKHCLIDHSWQGYIFWRNMPWEVQLLLKHDNAVLMGSPLVEFLFRKCKTHYGERSNIISSVKRINRNGPGVMIFAKYTRVHVITTDRENMNCWQIQLLGNCSQGLALYEQYLSIPTKLSGLVH